MKISIIGKGNMGKAIGALVEKGKYTVEYFGSKDSIENLGEIVVLAVPYGAIDSIIENNMNQLAGKIIVDVSNPVDFTSMNGLVVPSDTSAAEIIAQKVPFAHVIKAFNTNFAATLVNQSIGNKEGVTVLLASDNQEAKNTLFQVLDGNQLKIVDAGMLIRSRELEAIGFLQITLAIHEKISWMGGFTLLD